MDLLFKRYANPFILLDNLLLTNSLSAFIDDVLRFKQEDEMWEFFLHKVYDKSWKEFIDELNVSNDTQQVDIGATIVKFKNILNNFTPE